MNKALHEAKVHTSWINPNAEYDAAVGEFVARILDPDRRRPFLADFEPFQTDGQPLRHVQLARRRRCSKLTAPGVPDTYQGTELWDFSLVDPDNRRPVDYELRARLLEELAAGSRRPRWPDPRAGRAQGGWANQAVCHIAGRPVPAGP